MNAITSQVNRLTIVYSTVYLDADQRKHQSSASLAFVLGIHRWPMNSPHKGSVTRKKVSILWRHHVLQIFHETDELCVRSEMSTCRRAAVADTVSTWTPFCRTTMAWKLILFLIGMPYSHSLKIDRTNEGLDVVPRNLDVSVSILILAENILETLNSTSFDIYFQLTEINLRFCQTTYIEDGTFDNQHNLVTLHLGRCRIIQLPRSFGPSTATLMYFQMFRGYESSLIFRHPYFASFRNLYYLDIGAGKNLEPFNVSILPSNIARCRLDLSGLLTFPDFRNYSKLTLLTVMGNSISIIPQDHISTLTVLQSFRASQNIIKAIPNFSHMILLRFLNLNDNSITSFTHGHISGLVSLGTLKAGHNLIQNMPNISYLPRLESADFSNNLIRHVSASCLYGLPMINTLDLNGNWIVRMDDNSMPRGSLYLHNNQLTSPPDLYDTKFTSLTLNGNPIVCDQLLCWLRMWPFDKTLPLIDELYCTAPSFLNGSLVLDTHPVKLGCYKGKSPEYYSVLLRWLTFMWFIYSVHTVRACKYFVVVRRADSLSMFFRITVKPLI